MGRKITNVSKASDLHMKELIMDPTIKEPQSQSGNQVCPVCDAFFENKHWYPAGEKVGEKTDIKFENASKSLCPGCFAVEHQIAEGEVRLESPELVQHGDEVLNLIANVEAQCQRDNPKSRIFTIKREGSLIEFKTTTKWLATRIGKQIQKAFNGSLAIKRAPYEKYVRVHWAKN